MSAVEHDAVLVRRGFGSSVEIAPVDDNGRLDLDELASLLSASDKKVLVA